jgi:hypothetical protein
MDSKSTATQRPRRTRRVAAAFEDVIPHLNDPNYDFISKFTLFWPAFWPILACRQSASSKRWKVCTKYLSAINN